MEREIYSVVDICFLNLTLMIFEKQGDSGVMMLDKQGQLCGLLIGGWYRTEILPKKSYLERGFFIPIDIVFDDIERLTALKFSISPP